MSAEEAKAVLRRWYDEMWAQGRHELVTELAGPLYVRHEMHGTRTVTAEEYAEQVKGVVAGAEIADLSYDLVAEGDKVVAIGTWTFNGSRWSWVQAFRVEDGKLVETWLSGIATDTEW